ncbi:hypothetical protein R3P38DRAFT_2526930 [Favolaschia claudopus]|uniref:NAD(P)-binding protein n=1 Tax=Favolaschia claudopus TaxID=2862362 RepID=A0AAW0BNU1_9AGAR
MPVDASAGLRAVSLTNQNKTAVIVGGTLGIGAAVARLLAKLGCSRIIILGRNERRGKAVVDAMKELAPEGSGLVAEFLRADLSDSKGMRDAAAAMQNAVGEKGIDFLVMTQNGTPAGRNIVFNSDGHDTAFAVQAISRFALGYLLTTSNALAPNAIVLSVANQGVNLPSFSVDDLSLKEPFDKGRSAPSLFMDQSRRDSTLLDSVFEEFNIRFPQYRYYSIHPGLVKTEEFSLDFSPGYIKILMWLGLKLMGIMPDEYAPYPVYILIGKDKEEKLGSGRYFNRVLSASKLGKWASEPENRKALWVKLEGIVVGK